MFNWIFSKIDVNKIDILKTNNKNDYVRLIKTKASKPFANERLRYK